MKSFSITYLHHSGFILETRKDIFVFDYYLDPKNKLEELLQTSEKPLYFFVSHFHGDHFNPAIGIYEERATGYYLHSDCSLPTVSAGKLHKLNPGEFAVTDNFQIKMYGSTDAGGSFLINYPGIRIFHAGDLNWWHWAGEDDTSNRMARQEYFEELKKIKEKEFDVVFFPVDARQEVAREWGVRAFLEERKVKGVLVPMHAFGPRWTPSYEFQWRFPTTPMWIPTEEGSRYEGGFL